MTPMAQISLSSATRLVSSRYKSVCLVSGLHWLSVPCLLEYLRRHIPRGTTRRREHVELLLVHYPRQPKVRNQQVGVILWCAE